MKDLQIFKNAEFNVRTYGDWFVGMDVSRSLGYSNAYGALVKHVSPEDKKLDKVPSRNPKGQQNGGSPQNTIVINESGLYTLIMGSKLASARRFKRWVTSEVLPSIRKTGSYGVEPVDYSGEDIMKALTNPRALMQILGKLADQQDQLEIQAPKVQLAETLLMAKNCITMGEFAKLNDTGRTRLFKILRKIKIVDSFNVAYQRYVEQGYFKIIESVKHGKTYVSTLVTPKGQAWLLKTLRKEIY